MKITLRKGEAKWSEQGTHVWDDKGFTVFCDADCEVEIKGSKEAAEAFKFISEDRIKRGVNPDDGVTPICENPTTTVYGYQMDTVSVPTEPAASNEEVKKIVKKKRKQ